jgi:hypothetical protein
MSKITAATAADFIALVSISHGDGEGKSHRFKPGDRIAAGLLPLATAENLERDLAIVRADSPEAKLLALPLPRCAAIDRSRDAVRHKRQREEL